MAGWQVSCSDAAASLPAGVFAALSVNLRKYRYRFADVHSSDAQLMQQFSVKKARARAPSPATQSRHAAPAYMHPGYTAIPALRHAAVLSCMP